MKETNTDQLVMDLLAKVEDKKRQIGNAERPQWVTNCSFGYSLESNSRVNLQIVTDIEVLVDRYAFLSAKWEAFNCARVALGLPDTVRLTYMGYRYDQWTDDIKTRIASLQIKSRREELAKLEARVNALVSPEQRRAIELAKLVKEIG